MLALANELAAHIDVAGMCAHCAARVQAAFHEQMRIVPHDLAVLAGARLRLVGIHHEIMRAPVRLLRHERPLQPGRESRAAASALTGGLHLVDDPVAALLQYPFCAIPGAASARAREPPVMEPVEVGEDAVLIVEH